MTFGPRGILQVTRETPTSESGWTKLKEIFIPLLSQNIICHLKYSHTHILSPTLSLSLSLKKTLWIPSPGYRPHFTHYNIWMSRKCISHFPSLSTGVMEKTGKLFIISVCWAQQTHNLLLVFFHRVGIQDWGNMQEKRFFLQSLRLRQYDWKDMPASFFGLGNSIFASALIPREWDSARKDKEGGRWSSKDTHGMF